MNISLFLYFVLQLEAEFDQNLFVNPGTYLRDYLEYRDEYFPSSGMRGSVYVVDVADVYKKMDIAKNLVRGKILTIETNNQMLLNDQVTSWDV